MLSDSLDGYSNCYEYINGNMPMLDFMSIVVYGEFCRIIGFGEDYNYGPNSVIDYSWFKSDIGDPFEIWSSAIHGIDFHRMVEESLKDWTSSGNGKI